MADYTLYLHNNRENAFKFLGVIIHDEAEALANTTGQPTFIYKKQGPLEVF